MKPGDKESRKLAKPGAGSTYKGQIKLPRASAESIVMRGTQSYIFIEFTSLNIPRIQIDIEGS